MAKYHGKIGYAISKETSPGVWTDELFEKEYYGDILRNVRKWQSGDSINDNLTINNSFSIIADTYALEHFYDIRYITWQGRKWKVTDAEINRPRITLNIGGVYNE